MSDESYDVYTVAFGIRNMTHIDTVSADNFHFCVSSQLCITAS